MKVYLLLNVSNHTILKAYLYKEDANNDLEHLNNIYSSTAIEYIVIEYVISEENIVKLFNSIFLPNVKEHIFDFSDIFKIDWELYDKRNRLKELYDSYVQDLKSRYL